MALLSFTHVLIAYSSASRMSCISDLFRDPRYPALARLGRRVERREPHSAAAHLDVESVELPVVPRRALLSGYSKGTPNERQTSGSGYENTRGFLRDLPDNELLTLVGRLATEYMVRNDGAIHLEVALIRSVGAGVGVAKAVLEARRGLRGSGLGAENR